MEPTPPPPNEAIEATPLTDQDKIRLKRIAKLSAAASTSAAKPAVPTPTPPKRASPSAAPPTPVEPKKPEGITIHPAGHAAKLSAPPQSIEDWENAAMTNILNLTLDREVASASNWSIVYLKALALETIEENPALPQPIKLNIDLLSPLLLARLSLDDGDSMTDDPEIITVISAMGKSTLFEYLSGCWKRERIERSALLQKKGMAPKAVTERLEKLNEIKSLLISYIGFVLDSPTMFPQASTSSAKSLGPLELLPLLVPTQSTTDEKSPLTASDLPSLLQDLATRFTPSKENDFDDSPEFVNILSTIINHLGQALMVSQSDIGGGGGQGVGAGSSIGWRESLGALVNLLEVKGAAASLEKIQNFSVSGANCGEGVGKSKARAIEVMTLLGPWFRLGSFPDAFPSIAKNYFPNPTEMSREDLKSANANLRGTLQGLQTSQFNIISLLVRASPASKEAVLQYFAETAAMNAKLAAIQVNRRLFSSDGFVGNLFVALVGLCGPFMDSGYSKIDKIDPLYYKNSNRINIKEATKMSATQQESDAYYALDESNLPPAPNFISEVFFLTCTYLHIGPMHTIREHKDLSTAIGQLKRALKNLELDNSFAGTPNEAMHKAQIDREKATLNSYESMKHAMEVQLLDPEYLTRTIGFVNLVMAWLVRMADPKQQHPKVRVDLPLPETTPEVLRFLPEFLIEDITEFLSFVSKYASQVLSQGSQDELITFMLVFLSTPYMKNPYLKGQFIEIMFYLSQPTRENPRGSLGDALNFHPLALKNLIFCLCNAYVEIESTGSHNQFYDKFNIRYYITQLFRLVWTNPSHREALKAESLHPERYVRFVNLLMNDTTFLLEESLSLLFKITEIQKQMDDTVSWDAKTAAEKTEIEKNLREYESRVRGDLDLGTESLRLIKLFTVETVRPFLAPEIVDRLAAMLDANLNMLAGPKCQDLKVKNPEQYRFRPKDLLSDILQIFLHLGPHDEFRAAVAKDGRSYSKDLFERADRFARKMALKVDNELDVLREMVDAVEVLRQLEEDDDAMGEIPDDYLDPLTYDIMKDPVVLPSSKTIVDRSTIKQHYLSDATDPFNRVPLKWEDIVDAVELKAEIGEFLRKRKEGKSAAVDVEMN